MYRQIGNQLGGLRLVLKKRNQDQKKLKDKIDKIKE
jgi:hypothetical protein